MSDAFRLRESMDTREKAARGILSRLDEFKRDAGWEQYVTKLTEYDLQWRAKLARENKPWPHATDYNTYLTWSKVEDLHAVLFSFFATHNYYKAIPVSSQRGGHDRELLRQQGEDQTELMKWSQQNESNASGFLDQFIHNGLLYGAGFGQLDYLRDMREVRTEFDVPEEVREADIAKDGAKNILMATLGNRLRSAVGGSNSSGYECDFVDDDGEEKYGRFWVIDDHPFHRKGEIVVISQRDSVLYDAPSHKVIPPWHFFVPGHEKGLQSAHRYWTVDFFSPDDIRMFVNLGIFNALSRDQVKALLREDSPLLREDEVDMPIPQGSGTLQYGDERLDDTRDESMTTPRLGEYREKMMHEVVFEWSVDRAPDGTRASYVKASFVTPMPMLAMKQRVETIWAHGRRPHMDWHCYPVDGRYNGMGVPEVLESSQKEQNAFYQARSDVLEIITKPGGLYASLSGLAPDEITYYPGMMIKSRNPATDFRPLEFPVQPGFLFQEQVGHDREAERAIGATDLGLGRQGQQNAPRTLGGTAIVVRQQQLRSDVLLRRLMYGRDDRPSGVLEYLHQYRELLTRYMPDHKEVLITGTNEVRSFNREALMGRYVFMVSFDEEINNPQLRATNATQRYQLLASEPLFLQNPQARWYLVQDFMRNTGMANGPVILPPPEEGDIRPDMTQEQENLVMAQGMFVPPKPGDDHAIHSQVIAELINDPVRMTEVGFTQKTIPLLERHLAMHNQLRQSITEMQQGGPPPAGQQARPSGNAPLDVMRPTSTLAQTGLGRSEQTDLDQGTFG